MEKMTDLTRLCSGSGTGSDSVGTQCGYSRYVEEENIVVLKKCFSPQRDLDSDKEIDDDTQVG